MSGETQQINGWRAWFLAARPKTLPAGMIPVMAAGAIAWDSGYFHLAALLAALFGSLLIQIGTNFANDLFDYKKNADTAERTGPIRVTQAGLVTPRLMAMATMLIFSTATLIGIYLVYRGGWPILIIGVVSIACGVLYTAGRWALGYIGLGDAFVFIFYGPVALAGTYYVQALDISSEIILAGIPFGMISTSILVVNNLRDIENDRKCGKKTLAVRLGKRFSQIEYTVLLVGAAIVSGIIGVIYDRLYLFLTFAYLPFSIGLVKTIFTSDDGRVLNDALASTGKLLILFGILFGVGWLL